MKTMKNPGAVGWAALGMFAWGFLKASAVGRRQPVSCPLCAAHAVTRPRRLAYSLVLGPVVEELNYRHSLPRLLGPAGSAAVFGAMHASKRLSPEGNAARVAEAGLAGGLVYQSAYDRGGLVGSSLVHGAHNLGVDLGTYFTMRDRAREEGLTRVEVPVELRANDGSPVRATMEVCARHRGAS